MVIIPDGVSYQCIQWYTAETLLCLRDIHNGILDFRKWIIY